MRFRSLSLLVALLAVAAPIFVSGCGGGGGGGKASSSETVVNVAGDVISLATLEHWSHIQAVISHESIPRRPPPKGLVPDPPKFTDCIAYLREVLVPQRGASPLSSQQLESNCAADLRNLQRHVLETLIDYRWVKHEGEKRGIIPTTREVDKVLTNLYSNEETIRKVAANSGETQADLRLVAERNLLVEAMLKLEAADVAANHPGNKAQQEAQLRARATSFTKKWVSRTDCKPGYVIALCKQYKGALELELP